MKDTVGCILVNGFQKEISPMEALWGRMLAGRPLLDWVIRRATEAQQLDRVVVVAPVGSVAKNIAEITPANACIHISSKADSLGRLLDALTVHRAQAVVLIPSSAPLIDPTLIDRLAVVARKGMPDYASYCSHLNDTILQANLGLVAEWCRTSALETADQLIPAGRQRDDFSQFMVSHPESFVLKLLPLPKEIDRHDLRLSIRSQDDWDHAEQIVEALGHDRLDWKHIARLLDRQPVLRDRMARLNMAMSTGSSIVV